MKIIPKLISIIIFLLIVVLIIAYGRGYRLNFQKKFLSSTGILSITSFPSAAKIYLNGELKGVTDINLNLPPGQYQIEIKKDGFTSWRKTIKLKGELVYSINAFLIPINPSLIPLTNLGVVKAISIGESDRILIFSKNEDKTKEGIYLFDASKKPALLFPPIKLLLRKENLPQNELIDWQKTTVSFSPDFKEAIFDFPIGSSVFSYLLSLEEENKNLFEVTASKEVLLSAWKLEKEKELLKILETFPKDIVKIATDSFHIISFSPDKTKILYQAKNNQHLPVIIKPPLPATNQTKEERLLKKDNIYIYDKKEDKNYQIPHLQSSTFNYWWYFDSQHLIFLDGKKIAIIDYDGQNQQPLYSGPFNNDFFTVTSDGNLVILTNLNPETNKLADLYLVGIR